MIVELPDPVGEELESRTLYNGLELRKVRVPLGVVAIVYEARPNVTVDAAALAIKSGNAVVLRGSSTAERSNAVLARIVADTVEAAGLPAGSVTLIGGGDRSDLAELARQDRYVDLIIPRGGGWPEERVEGQRDGARDLRGRRQLPRVRGCRRRRGDGPAHRLQREGAATRCLQRGGDAARARRRRGGGAPRLDGQAARGGRRAAGRRAHPHACRGATATGWWTRPTRIGTPSTWS